MSYLDGYESRKKISFRGVDFMLNLSWDRVLTATHVRTERLLLPIDVFYIFFDNMLDYLNIGTAEAPIWIDTYENLFKLHPEHQREFFEYINEKFIIIKPKNDAEIQRNTSADYFDIEFDMELIFSSFYSQYGINLSLMKGILSWREFNDLLKGLNEDTPLMRTIAIRKSPIPLQKDYPTFGAWLTAYNNKKANELPIREEWDEDDLMKYHEIVVRAKFEKGGLAWLKKTVQ